MERNDWQPIARQIREAHAAAKAGLAARGYEIIATLEYLAEKAHWQAERAGWTAGLEAWKEFVAGGEAPTSPREKRAEVPAELGWLAPYVGGSAENTPAAVITRDNSPADPWEEKLEAKRERLRSRARRARAESRGAAARATAIADAIPLGQPILVGHHSEKRARRDAAKIRSGFEKAAALEDKAAVLERAADSVGTAGISSDDPGALEKLARKAESLEKLRKLEVRTNARIRQEAAKVRAKTGRDPGHDEHVRIVHAVTTGDAVVFLDRLLAAANAFPWLPQIGDGTQVELRRTRERIAELEARRSEQAREPHVFAGGVVEDDPEENRVRICLDAKPGKPTIEVLRSRGFVWSPSRGAWQRMRSSQAWHAALAIADFVEG